MSRLRNAQKALKYQRLRASLLRFINGTLEESRGRWQSWADEEKDPYIRKLFERLAYHVELNQVMLREILDDVENA